MKPVLAIRHVGYTNTGTPIHVQELHSDVRDYLALVYMEPDERDRLLTWADTTTPGDAIEIMSTKDKIVALHRLSKI
jgi:hypothetical protein